LENEFKKYDINLTTAKNFLKKCNNKATMDCLSKQLLNCLDRQSKKYSTQTSNETL